MFDARKPHKIMLIIYKSNLEEFLKEASFAVYSTISSASSQHYQSIKIVLSAWNYEDQPIQLHFDVDQVIYGDDEQLKAVKNKAFEIMGEIKTQITGAQLEARDGVFGTVEKPIMGTYS